MAPWFNDGGRYNPAGNSWTALTQHRRAHCARAAHTAVWTGSEMIVWGGRIERAAPRSLATIGGRYQLATDTWTTGDHRRRTRRATAHTAVWTGSEMIVWGGSGRAAESLDDGGRYIPRADTWTPAASTLGAPTGRARTHGGVDGQRDDRLGRGSPRTRERRRPLQPGSERLDRGGHARRAGRSGRSHRGVDWHRDDRLGRLGWQQFPHRWRRYNPSANRWTTGPGTGAPVARTRHTAVWTGSEMIIWGGYGDSAILNDGGRYDASAQLWKPINSSEAPSVRWNHTAVWTGSEVLVWGGVGGTTAPYFDDTISYRRGRILYLYQRP